jgi:ion channel-forming bestrophin family protein
MILKKNIPFIYILGSIRHDIVLVTLYAIVIGIIDEGLHIPNISIPVAVPTILGTAISLLLGFRTAQAYDRWWEARKVWGAIVNDSRSLVRQLINFIDPQNPEARQLVRQMGFRQIAWCYCLGQSLRKLDPLDTIDKLLPAQELDFIRKHDNKPNALLELHANDLQKALNKQWLNAYQQVALDETLSRLCDAMGKSERIKNTVFPTMYSWLIHFFLYVFVVFLPFGLVDYFGIMEVPLVITIAAIFFLIEKSAIYLQDPFENKPTDVSVTAISRTIEINLRQMLAEQHVPEKMSPTSFYIM